MRTALKVLSVTGAAAAVLTAAGTASAGRCGHSYPVDKPTTLVEVARQCNVNLSALYEANPGVNPGNVRPGEHLAVPDEINEYSSGRVASVPSDRSEYDPVSTHPYIASPDYRSTIPDDEGLSYSNYDVRDESYVRPVSVSATQQFRSLPTWRREETSDLRHHARSDRLSYQKQSAMRIQTAGMPVEIGRFASATPAPRTELVECEILHKSDGGKIHKVRNIIGTPQAAYVEIDISQPDGRQSCTLISAGELSGRIVSAHYITPQSVGGGGKLVNYGNLALMPDGSALSLAASHLTVSGVVLDVDRDCALLKTANGELWRVAPPVGTGDLLGRDVTVWGTSTVGGACGAGPSLKVSHTVFAEPW